MDLIKKGMGELVLKKLTNEPPPILALLDKHRNGLKIMVNFPADVAKAELLTGGNPNIVSTLETPTKKKSIGSTQATPEAAKKLTQPAAAAAAAQSTKKPTAHNSVFKVQSAPTTANKQLNCTMCTFSTDRMNVLMMHLKNHSFAQLPPSKGKH